MEAPDRGAYRANIWLLIFWSVHRPHMSFVVEFWEDLSTQLAGDFRVLELHMPLETGVAGEHLRALTALDIPLTVPLGHVVGYVTLSD